MMEEHRIDPQEDDLNAQKLIMDEEKFVGAEAERRMDESPGDLQQQSVAKASEETTDTHRVYASPSFTQALAHDEVPPVAPVAERAEPLEATAEQTPLAVMVESQTKQQKSCKVRNFWQANKALIATAVVCSLLGGVIGGGTMAALGSSKGGVSGGSAFPQGQAPINVTGGEVSPVIAIADAVSPAVVSITSKAAVQSLLGWQQVQGSGSGVVFRADGYIVTNNHVIANATALSVTMADGMTYDATVIGADETTDLAVIKIDAQNLPTATFGDSDQVKVGELAVAIGNPLGADFAGTVTDGIISGLNRTIQAEDKTYQVLQTNAAINSGNSGGALVNSKGEVIGINSVKVQETGVEGMGFAIPSNEVKTIVDEIMTNGYVSRPYIGIRGADVTQQLVEKYQLAVSNGVVVVEAIAGSPATKAGLQPGDIIYKVDDTILQSMDHLVNEILKAHKPGEAIKLLVDRNGKTLEISLTLGDQGKAQTQAQTQPQQNTQQFVIPFGGSSR